MSYTDSEFPATYESVYPNNLKQDVDETVDVMWVRARDFSGIEGKTELWEEAILGEHVN